MTFLTLRHILSVRLSSLGIKRAVNLSPPGVSSSDPAAVETRHLMYAMGRMLHRPDDSQGKVIEAIDKEMKSSTTTQKTEKRDRRFKPGRSPEDAFKILANTYNSDVDLYLLIAEQGFTIDQYHIMYEKYRNFFGFMALTDLRPDSQSRRDLNALVEQGLLDVDRTLPAHRYVLSPEGLDKVKDRTSMTFYKISPEAEKLTMDIARFSDNGRRKAWVELVLSGFAYVIGTVEGHRAGFGMYDKWQDESKSLARAWTSSYFSDSEEKHDKMRYEHAPQWLSVLISDLSYARSTRTITIGDSGFPEAWDGKGQDEKILGFTIEILESLPSHRGRKVL